VKGAQSEIHWIWQEFNEISGPQMHEILELRQNIFIVEQQCLYADVDGLDAMSLHLSGYDTAGRIIAYARLCSPGSRYEEPSIGRLLTIRKRRGSGLAREAIGLCLEKAKSTWHSTNVRISAQLYLRKFYADLGFTEIGNVYDEDGIKHIDMIIDLDS
jgi:ElaA protein